MMIGVAFSFSTLGILISGPSKLIGIPDKTWLRIVGWVILSFSRVIFDLCSLKELVRSVHLKSGLNLDNPILNERADLWHTLFCSLGSFLGPIIGAGLFQAFNESDFTPKISITDIFFLVSLITLFAHFILNIIFIPDHDSFPFGDSAYAATLSHSATDFDDDIN
jgi:hypothetical protein